VEAWNIVAHGEQQVRGVRANGIEVFVHGIAPISDDRGAEVDAGERLDGVPPAIADSVGEGDVRWEGNLDLVPRCGGVGGRLGNLAVPVTVFHATEGSLLRFPVDDDVGGGWGIEGEPRGGLFSVGRRGCESCEGG